MKKLWQRYSMSNGLEWLIILLAFISFCFSIFSHNWLSANWCLVAGIAYGHHWRTRLELERTERELWVSLISDKEVKE